MSRAQRPYGALYPFNTPDWQGGSVVNVGNVYFVGSTHPNAQDVPTAGHSPEFPFATLDYAISRCTASNGDVVYCMPGHAETTTAIGIDVVGVKVVGLGVGASRPTLTATTAATDLVNVSADDCWLENVRLVGAASGVTALLDVAADDFTLLNCSLESGAAPVDVMTVASGNRGRVLHCTFLGTAAGPDNAIMFQAGAASCTNWLIEGCLFNYLEFDIDENIIDIPADAHPGLVIKDCQMLGLAVQALTIKSSVANKFGFMTNCQLVAHAAAATIANLIGTTIEGMFFSEVYATDTTKTERGVLVPTTTPA